MGVGILLNMTDFSNIKTIHFIGVGGVSMKALSLLCLNRGIKVSGSDIQDSEALKELRLFGCDAYCGHDVSKVKNADLIVYNSAISQSDEELSYARGLGKLCLKRKDFLFIVSKLCEKTVAIAGTHGKTTVTALISKLMQEENKKFIGHIGGDFADGQSNIIDSGEEYFVTEACEYKRNFLSLKPDIAVILNMEFDHPDCYKSLADVEQAFKSFCHKVNDNGVIITTLDAKKRLLNRYDEGFEDEGVFKDYSATELEEIKRLFGDNVLDNAVTHYKKIITFGYTEENDFRAEKIQYKDGKYSFELIAYGKSYGRVYSEMFGKHNILNILASIAVCSECGMDIQQTINLLPVFSGVKRRFECKGLTAKNVKVISDYAHHPKEIEATIETARIIAKGRIIAVFEPHTYSRTLSMLNEFAASFYWCDEVIFLPTYSAREKSIEGGSSFDIFSKLSETSRSAFYFDSYEKAAEYINNTTEKGDMVLLLGAGSVDKLANLLI